jgi:hypothetical protein
MFKRSPAVELGPNPALVRLPLLKSGVLAAEVDL